MNFAGAVKWTSYDWDREPFADGTNASPVGADPALLNPRWLNRHDNNMADTRGYRCVIGRDGSLWVGFEAAGGNHIFRYHPHDLAVRSPIVGGDNFHQFVNTGSSHKTFVGSYRVTDGTLLVGQQFCSVFNSTTGASANTLRLSGGDLAVNELGQLCLGGASASGLPIPGSWFYTAKPNQVALNPLNPDEYTGGAYFWVMTPDLVTRSYVTRLAASGSTHAVDSRVLAGHTTARFAWGGDTAHAGPLFTRSAVQASPGYGARDGTFAVLGGDFISLPTGQVMLQWSGTATSVVAARSRLRDANEDTLALDLDGDGPDDGATGYAFRTDVPLSPLAAAAAYTGPKFYGAYRVLAKNNPAINLTDNHLEGNTLTLRVEPGSTHPVQVHGLLYFPTEETPGHAAGYAYQFTRFSDLSYSNQGNLPSRWLVREGERFFVSEAVLASGTPLTFESDHADGRWAAWAPDLDLNFAAEKALFAEQNFQNITAVGVVIDRDAFQTGRYWTKCLGFRAELARNKASSLVASPTAGFTATPMAGPRPLTVSLQAHAAGADAFHQWTLGNGSATSGSEVAALYTASGPYYPVYTLWDGQRQSAEASRKISVGSALLGSLPNQVAAWGGDVLSSTDRFDGLSSSSQDLNGDGTLDQVVQLPLSSTTPLVSSGRGTRWYGGLRAVSLNTTAFTAGTADIAQSSSGDLFTLRLQNASTAGQTVHGLFFLQKTDFLGLADRLPVSFDAESQLQLGSVANNENTGPLRWLVREGTQFYVSEATFTGAASLSFANAASDGRWAPYQPAESLDFSVETAVFAERNFADLTAFGFVIDHTITGTARWYLAFRDFVVSARTSPTGVSGPQALAAVNPTAGVGPLRVHLAALEPDLTTVAWEITDPAGRVSTIRGSAAVAEMLAAGQHTVTCRVTDVLGRLATSTQAVHVSSAANNFAAWAAGLGLVGAAADRGADPDKDGLSNLTEFALALSPLTPQAASPFWQEKTGAGWEVRFPLRKGLAAGAWRLEFSTQLSGGGWQAYQPHYACPLEDLGDRWLMRSLLPVDPSVNRLFVRMVAE